MKIVFTDVSFFIFAFFRTGHNLEPVINLNLNSLSVRPYSLYLTVLVTLDEGERLLQKIEKKEKHNRKVP